MVQLDCVPRAALPAAAGRLEDWSGAGVWVWLSGTWNQVNTPISQQDRDIAALLLPDLELTVDFHWKSVVAGVHCVHLSARKRNQWRMYLTFLPGGVVIVEQPESVWTVWCLVPVVF